MYRIIYEKRICKDLDKIPNADVERVNKVFKDLPLNPFPIGVKKLSGQLNFYRLRRGDYRIVYTIDHKEKEIKILLVGHRKESYRYL